MAEEADRRHTRMIGNAVCLGVHLANSVHVLSALRGEGLMSPQVYNMHRQQYIFITIWNLIIQMAYLAANTMCLAQEVYNIKDRGLLKPVKEFKQLLFDGVLLPYTLMVTIIFWPFFIYDRELLYPAFVDEAIGALPNYIMHAFILPVALCELRYMPRKATSERSCLILLTVTTASYLVVSFTNHYMTGLWPYPILHSLNGTVYLYLFIAFTVVLLYVCYYLQFPLRTRIGKKYEGKTKKVN